jgi:Cu(I)/Ag(I) efflux system membrane fusion protein
MHPEIVRDEPGDCPICGMPLVPASELGYVPADELEDAKPLIIPVTAALKTGTRGVVYVAVPGAEKTTFEGREVVLGPRAGDYYIVRSGLSEGELVVVNGNFKIDSALQILAKPSMMLPEESTAPAEQQRFGATPEFQEQLAGVYSAYVELQEALAGDDPAATKTAAAAAKVALEAVDMKLLEGEAHMAWMPVAKDMNESLAVIAAAPDLAGMRPAFETLSEHMLDAIQMYGLKDAAPVYVAHCPMALDGKGANWLQTAPKISNPYFGAAMPGCGDIVEKIEAEVAP